MMIWLFIYTSLSTGTLIQLLSFMQASPGLLLSKFHWGTIYSGRRRKSASLAWTRSTVLAKSNVNKNKQTNKSPTMLALCCDNSVQYNLTTTEKGKEGPALPLETLWSLRMWRKITTEAATVTAAATSRKNFPVVVSLTASGKLEWPEKPQWTWKHSEEEWWCRRRVAGWRRRAILNQMSNGVLWQVSGYTEDDASPVRAEQCLQTRSGSDERVRERGSGRVSGVRMWDREQSEKINK